MTSQDEVLKSFCLSDELDTSIKLIRLGLGELQNIDSINDFYYLPFQLLSSGFERLMKCTICLGYYNHKGKYPKVNTIKTHDLIKLKNIILEHYFVKDSPQGLKEDFQYLSNDRDIDKLIFLLSEFGKFARYYNLDVVTGVENVSIDVKSLWQEYETKLFINDTDLSKDFGDIEKQEENRKIVITRIVVQLERFARALCRQYTLGNVCKNTKQFTVPILDFAMMHDDVFGNKDYRKHTTKYNSQNKKVHKRTIFDELKRKFNKNFKSKKFFKKEFDGEWPFYAEEVIIECRYKHWCVITIEGNDYALNGAASGKYKLENVHEAGVAILGVSIGPFIDEALKLS